jgi:RNA polymerase sigma-70 factor (sigma-E family)
VDERDRAFTDYVHARAATMLRTAVHLCAGDVAAAEDLVQNTLVRTYVSWNRVRDPGLRDAYVRRIMVRVASRPPRKPMPVAFVPEPVPGRPHEERYVERDALNPYLAALPPKQRAVVVLRYYEDLSEREIAEALGCAPGTVKAHASRALATLRARMSEGASHE